uniref:Uncharacterized protein n=1 Tax=Myoviridae sp. ctLnO19 TaxID=2825085 RepID=A0A8S5P0A2_9CAUD|nr:MAG TPA: hypothetical protein [Myoviridae sp. ctLnO19]
MGSNEFNIGVEKRDELIVSFEKQVFDSILKSTTTEENVKQYIKNNQCEVVHAFDHRDANIAELDFRLLSEDGNTLIDHVVIVLRFIAVVNAITGNWKWEVKDGNDVAIDVANDLVKHIGNIVSPPCTGNVDEISPHDTSKDIGKVVEWYRSEFIELLDNLSNRAYEDKGFISLNSNFFTPSEGKRVFCLYISLIENDDINNTLFSHVSHLDIPVVNQYLVTGEIPSSFRQSVDEAVKEFMGYFKSKGWVKPEEENPLLQPPYDVNTTIEMMQAGGELPQDEPIPVNTPNVTTTGEVTPPLEVSFGQEEATDTVEPFMSEEKEDTGFSNVRYFRSYVEETTLHRDYPTLQEAYLTMIKQNYYRLLDSLSNLHGIVKKLYPHDWFINIDVDIATLTRLDKAVMMRLDVKYQVMDADNLPKLIADFKGNLGKIEVNGHVEINDTVITSRLIELVEKARVELDSLLK